MAYISSGEIEKRLIGKPYLQDKLYTNGFLITEKSFEITGEYPFYGNWSVSELGCFKVYTHKNTRLTVKRDGEEILFMLGHAVDPFDHLADEVSIMKKLALAYSKGLDTYLAAQNDLTGVYCTGLIRNREFYLTNDCAGMQIVYYGTVNGDHFFTSHSKLAADLLGLSQSNYIGRLVNSRFYHYMGTWLPGDLSPYPELRRLVPNHFASIMVDGSIETSRFFPGSAIKEIDDQEAFNKTIFWLSDVLHDTLSLYADKWPDRNLAISVTGGRDSTTTLACANGLYDRFMYFSYISNEAEKTDAYAAKEICSKLGLEHEIYEIPQNDSELEDVEAFASVLECNAGCIGHNNPNDVRKRLYFILNPKYDVEVKSWVNEVGRGLQYVKYNKKRFPRKPNASYCRAMHKIYIAPRLIHDTDKILKAYLNEFLTNDVQKKVPWIELFWWEFAWGGGEGIFLTAEHRTSSEIIIPYNNRRYLARMLTVPLDQRIADAIPISIIKYMNPAITNSGIVVKNVKHTDKRALLMRAYLEVFSRIRF